MILSDAITQQTKNASFVRKLFPHGGNYYVMSDLIRVTVPILVRCANTQGNLLKGIDNKTIRIGLAQTGHTSFLNRHDRTPKFVGQILPDRTNSRLKFFNILHTT